MCLKEHYEKKKTYYNVQINFQTNNYSLLNRKEKRRERKKVSKKSHYQKYLEKLLECCLEGSLSKIKRKMHLERLLGMLDFTSIK